MEYIKNVVIRFIEMGDAKNEPLLQARDGEQLCVVPAVITAFVIAI